MISTSTAHFFASRHHWCYRRKKCIMYKSCMLGIISYFVTPCCFFCFSFVTSCHIRMKYYRSYTCDSSLFRNLRTSRRGEKNNPWTQKVTQIIRFISHSQLLQIMSFEWTSQPLSIQSIAAQYTLPVVIRSAPGYRGSDRPVILHSIIHVPFAYGRALKPSQKSSNEYGAYRPVDSETVAIPLKYPGR